MPLQITIKLNGIQEQQQRLDEFAKSISDFSEAMVSIGQALTSYFSRQVFASQGTVFGSQWAPLSPVTLYMRGAEHTKLTGRQANFVGFLHNKQGQQGTLRRLGAGVSSATPLTTGHPDGMQFSFVAQTTANSVVIINTKPYFKYHQSTDPRTRLPRRQMLGINEDVISIVQQYIEAELIAKIEVIK